MDAYCANCLEPWDSWTVLSEWDEPTRESFLAGEACPCCHMQQENWHAHLTESDAFRMYFDVTR